MLSKPNESFNVGDVVVWGSLTFLVTDIDEDEQIYTKGKIQLCNNTLKFYSPTDSTLYQIPCIIGNKLTLKEENNNYISTVDNQLYLIIRNDSINKEIKAGDIFKIGTYNYKIMSVFDDISVLGLLQFKLEYSEQEATTHTFTISILNGSTIDLQESTTLQLNVNVYDNGVLVSPTPSLSFTSSDTTICTVGSSTGLVTALDVIDDCVISVSANGVSDSIVVNVIEAEQHNYTYTLSSTSTPDSEIKLNQTKTYTAYKYDNGVVTAQGFTFSVSGDSTAYTLIIVNGNSCTIKCLKSGYSIVLSATDTSDVTKVTSKTIVLKSLF